MESQGSRALSAGVVGKSNVPKRSCAAQGKTLVHWLVWCTLLCLGVAQATSYVYDANGRVVAVTQSSGASEQYAYDALGNQVQIGGVIPAGQLALFAFSPTHGIAGTTVTIEGQSFSGTLVNNSVSFNGSPAIVLSATSTQLVTSVPVAASTGPISVTVGGQTANSASPFVVDDTGVPPTISGVSPTTVAVGGTVAVAGAHLDPLPGQTSAQMGGRDVSLSSVADGQLQFVISAAESSGYVAVQTPYGLATSPTPVVVVPNGISAANVVSSGYAAVNGSPVNLSIGAVGQVGAVLFNAT